MGKLIIDNRTDRPMSEILIYAKEVVQMGRQSNYKKQYCYLSVYKTTKDTELHIASDLNKKSDRLTIYEVKP